MGWPGEAEEGTNNKLIMAEFNLAALVSGRHTVDASSLLVPLLLDLKRQNKNTFRKWNISIFITSLSKHQFKYVSSNLYFHICDNDQRKKKTLYGHKFLPVGTCNTRMLPLKFLGSESLERVLQQCCIQFKILYLYPGDMSHYKWTNLWPMKRANK